MAEKTVPELIFDKFNESIKDDKLFSNISADLVNAMREKYGKNKIKELLRKIEK